MEQQLQFRARVVAMYQKYCPEKPLSHVEFLLTKYKGFESELMEVLTEKYGPEPTTIATGQRYEMELAEALGPGHTPASISAVMQNYQGMEEALLRAAKEHSPLRGASQRGDARVEEATREQAMLIRETDADRDAVFRHRQEQFRRDMAALSKERQHQAAQALQDAIHSAQDTVQAQEREIRTLRSDLQAIRARHEETSSRLQEEVRVAACSLTKMRLELMRLEGLATPGESPLSQLVSVENETTALAGETLQALQSLYVYERVARTHLALHPVTPLRTRLREIDPALSARLDTL